MTYPILDGTNLATVHPDAHNAWVDVRLHYSATLNGVTDDTTAIQSAITATPNYGACFIPPTAAGAKITSALTIDHPMTLFGFNSLVTQATAATKGIIVTSSNVTIEGLHLYGKQHANYVNLEQAINVTAPSWAAAYTNVNIHDNWIENWGQYGIYAQWLTDFDFSHNRIHDIGYSGMGTLSVQDGVIGQNRIDTIGPGTGGASYGLFVSRITTDAGELTTHPRSSDVTIIGNTIKDVTLYEGIDTHATQRVTIIGNTVSNCPFGISINPGPNSAAVLTYAPLETIISGNTMDSLLTNGTAQYGISLAGAAGSVGAPTQRATGSITGNTIIGYGNDATFISGAVYVHDTDGLVVSGNLIKNASCNGISAYNDNRGIAITGNTFIDPWSEVQGIAVAVDFTSFYNTGVVSGNSFVRGDLSHTSVLTVGVRVGGNTGNTILVSSNRSAATQILNDVGGTATVLDHFGTGSPENAVTGTKGSTFRRTDGGANTSFYVKESGSATTGWVAK